MTCEVMFLSPLPRYLFTPCCAEAGHCEGLSDSGHAADLLQKSNSLRKAIREYLTAHHTKITVPELFDKMFPTATSPAKLVAAFEGISDADSVHLTPEGYQEWVKAILMLLNERQEAGVIASLKPKQYFWRGFISPVGLERPVNQASVHANRAPGGGKWARGNGGRGRGSDRGGRGGRGGHGPYARKRY